MTLSLRASLIIAGLVLLPITASAQTPDELRARAIELSFNLDHAEALATIRQAIAADPANLAGYRLLATVLWARTLIEQGAITAEDFMGESLSPFRARQSNADLEQARADLLRRTEALAAQQRGASRPNVDATYQIGAAYRVLSGMAGTIDGSQWRSIGAARRAYQDHQRVLQLDPSRKDAALTVGMYRFLISKLSTWSRLAARVAGFDSDGAGGVRLVEDTAANDGPAQTNAMFSLIAIYNQAGRYDDALKVIGDLRRRFPRNRLLWLEAASTELRAGRAADARLSLERGLQVVATESRPLGFGELARWRYNYGVSLARLQRSDAATQQFRAALQATGLEWVHGRAHLELGKLALRSGQAPEARNEFRAALRMCEVMDDTICITESKGLLGSR
jgi:tetratricopeptide (TPR) repeat protein